MPLPSPAQDRLEPPLTRGPAVLPPTGDGGAELARRLRIDFEERLPPRPPSARFLELIPISFARRYAILAFAEEDGVVPVAAADLEGIDRADALGRLMQRPLRLFLAPQTEIAAAINAAYQVRASNVERFIDDISDEQLLEQLEGAGEGREDLLDVAGRAPVVKLVNLILFEAVKRLASDVHIQPYEQSVVVRLRIDGMLFDAFTLPRQVSDELASRIKIIGKMNIAEKRLPQDGRATVQLGDRIVDLRISSVPASHGERLVIRVLDKSARLYTLNELGMDARTLDSFRRRLKLEHGLMLVTGPTGSGKTTTLYAALQEVDAKAHNIITLEDPIEYQLDGISQIQISTKKGMTFASGLRSVLRQDPDIIMVGEIRDRETAELAIQSALTGHLVYSTLHTNDASTAVTRLLDLGVEPYLVASSLIGVMAQRLVRRICPHCAQLREASDNDQPLLRSGSAPAAVSVPQAVGCDACRHTGFLGRVGIFEFLAVESELAELIHSQATAAAIKQRAVQQGMSTLQSDGLAKVAAGRTTPEEILRVTSREGA